MKLNFIYKMTFFCSFFLMAIKSLGFVDPNIEWGVINTPHFEVLHDVRHEETARQYALKLELNYQRLGDYFTDFPDKTIVVINDNTDLTNGYATYIPYPHIVLYPVLPDTHLTISDYGDWIQELTVHEYTHILNFHPAHGLMGLFRSTLGTIGTPNLFLPRWWHEGIAVEMETRFSNHGRLRSIFQDATLRALVKSDQLQTYSVADINETDTEKWPRGAHPYLFGSVLLSQIQSQFRAPINNVLLQRFSRRVPFFFRTPFIEETGASIETWFAQAKAEIQLKATDQLNRIREKGSTPVTPLADHFMESYSPRISEDGRYLALIIKDEWAKASIKIYDRLSKETPFDTSRDSSMLIDAQRYGFRNLFHFNEDAPPNGDIHNLTWHPRSNRLIFDRVKAASPYANFSDLYSYDLKKKKTLQLTHGLRLREPNLSPSGRLLTAIQLTQSYTRVVQLLFGDKKERVEVLVQSPVGHRYTSPTYLDETHILFTERDNKGTQSLFIFDTAAKTKNPLDTRKLRLEQIKDIHREKDKLLFTAEENGLKNLYVTSNLFKSAQRLTQTETAALDGAIDERRHSVLSTQVTDQGLSVGLQPLAPSTTPPVTKTISPLLSDRYPKNTQHKNDNELPALESQWGKDVSASTSYRPHSYLLPRYWLPFLFVSDSGYGTQISTAGFDPLNKHNYSATFITDSFSQQKLLNVAYVNSQLGPPTQLQFQGVSNVLNATGYGTQAYALSLMTTHDLSPNWSGHSIGWGFSGTQTHYISLNKESQLQRAGLNLMYAYDGRTQSSFSPTPIAGDFLRIADLYLFANSDRSVQNRLHSNWTHFFSSFLPDKHLALLHFKSQDYQGSVEKAEYSLNDTINLDQTFTGQNFFLRGYERGYFYFKSARQLTFEYQAPIGKMAGFGLLPVFLKRTRFSFLAEALSLQGFVLNYQNLSYDAVNFDRIFTSTGFEIKADLSLGFSLPVTMFYGYYYRPEYSGPDKTLGFIGIQI